MSKPNQSRHECGGGHSLAKARSREFTYIPQDPPGTSESVKQRRRQRERRDPRWTDSDYIRGSVHGKMQRFGGLIL